MPIQPFQGGLGQVPRENMLIKILPILVVVIVLIVLFNVILKSVLKKMEKKNKGIIFLVLGGTAGIWVITRLTSLAGKFHSWEPPFTSYETTTIIGAVIAILLIIIGLVWVTQKKENQK